MPMIRCRRFTRCVGAGRVLRFRLISFTPILAVLALAVAPVPSAASVFRAFEPTNDDALYPRSANGRLISPPTVRTYEMLSGESVKIDGKLDDAVWLKAEGAAGFTVWEPDRGKVPTEETVFKVAHDRDAIYFAVACPEKDPAKISKKLSRRDRFSNSDLVSVYIDPYHDRTTGYNFRVNPLGVQTDAYIYNDGSRDDNWDAVWQGEVSEDEGGWYAEIRIPFSAIRYRPGLDTWGLQVYRYMHGRGEDTAWVTWNREQSGFVSRFGTLVGMEDVPPPRQLEILPYVVGRVTDPSAPPSEDGLNRLGNFGADLKYGLTSDLTLNGTVQPDFGQVEADPAELNLSPFETFFEEKRPFFIEGSRFFEQPVFTMFYSRRIGTGDANSRIRYAAKLTGKTKSDVSLAMLVASTDVTGEGQAHNPFKSGDQPSRFFVTRLGKEFAQGRYRFNVMQTAALRRADRVIYGNFASRDAYTTGLDFDLKFRDRKYRMLGNFAGSVIDPSELAGNPRSGLKSYGTAGHLEAQRQGGRVKASVWGHWASDRLDLNDLGYLPSADAINAGGLIQYVYSPEGKNKHINQANLNLNVWKNWLYGARTGYDLRSGRPVWSYGRALPQVLGGTLEPWVQFRNYRELWAGVEFAAESYQRYETRSTVTLLPDAHGNVAEAPIPGGGPLMKDPFSYGGWLGGSSDTRRDFVVQATAIYFEDVKRNSVAEVETSVRWNQSSAVNHELALEFGARRDDTQHMGNFENPGRGIGGVSYVFARLSQRTVDLTLRTSLLFSRNQSLEIYAQPFITVGNYSQARELAAPFSYDFVPYARGGYKASDHDFGYSSVNLNAVYRWEYRPGSTFYLVWTHSRSDYEERAAGPQRFNNRLRTGAFFDTEPENRILAKISYWIPV
jgi:hypothetical protein